MGRYDSLAPHCQTRRVPRNGRVDGQVWCTTTLLAHLLTITQRRVVVLDWVRRYCRWGIHRVVVGWVWSLHDIGGLMSMGDTPRGDGLHAIHAWHQWSSEERSVVSRCRARLKHMQRLAIQSVPRRDKQNIIMICRLLLLWHRGV